MATNNKIIVPVALSADHFYAMQLGVTITSIRAHKTPGSIIKIYIIDGGLAAADKEKLEVFNQGEITLEYLKVDIGRFSSFPVKRHWQPTTYYRLLAPEIVPHEKIIYLDSDIIVNDDLANLYQIDLENHVLAAVRDASENYVRKYYFRPICRYFNAGVLLINKRLWKEKDVWARALNFIKSEADKIKYVDQDILNHLLENDWLEIDRSYNIQLDIHQPWERGRQIKILHFVGERKPWHYLYGNRYKKYFIKYLRSSPWRDYQYPDKNFKTFFQRYILEPVFIFIKRMIKRWAPDNLLLILKNIFWRFSVWRDSRR